MTSIIENPIKEIQIVVSDTAILAEIGREFPPQYLIETGEKASALASETGDKQLQDHAEALCQYAIYLQADALYSDVLAADIVASLLVVLKGLYSTSRSVSAETPHE